MEQALQLFKCLADDTRLKMILLMQTQGELCVCELEDTLNISQPKASRHLALLKKHDIVADRRESLWVYYRLNPQLPEWIQDIINATSKATTDDMQNCIQLLHEVQKTSAICEKIQ